MSIFQQGEQQQIRTLDKTMPHVIYLAPHLCDEIELRMLNITIQHLRENMNQHSSLYLTTDDILKLPFSTKRTVLALNSFNEIHVPENPKDYQIHAQSLCEKKMMNVQVLQASPERETWFAMKDPLCCIDDMEDEDFLIQAMELSSPSSLKEAFVSVSVLNRIFANEEKTHILIQNGRVVPSSL